MKKRILMFHAALVIFLAGCSLNRSEDTFSQWDHSINFGWTFAGGSHPGAELQGFDDSDWETVDLPHDWAISGPFGPLDSDGNTGKLPWKGEGWYRKVFELPLAAEGRRLQFLFDGIMANPTVYLNGQEVGSWRYGYNSFWIDATEAARFGDTNVLAVHADTRDHSSRWYPGAGIYRKVGMRLVDPVHIPVWGLHVTTPEVSAERALVNASIQIANGSESGKKAILEFAFISPSGEEVARTRAELPVKGGETVNRSVDMEIPHPAFWDVDTPDLYTCTVELVVNNRVIQHAAVHFGIRTFQWTADDGFHLNGRRLQIHGVNLHHDQGPLGSAFYPRAMERQLQIMKEMGVNALRTSHNAPAPEVLDLCDRMGIIVWDELFDKYGPKAGVRCSTAEFVDRYAEEEVANFVRRDRNHPSVLIWSIGNEIADLLNDSDGKAAGHVASMVSYFKKYDVTRPTTMGCHIESASGNGKHILDALETSGWNYDRRYASTRLAYPDMPIIYSESASAFGTRGAYKLKLPASKTDWSDDGQLTAYMLTSAAWSDIPEIEFEYMRIDTFVAGEFVWTGFDYLGEPTPVMVNSEPWARGRFKATKEGYSARSSYFGIVDLAGFPKDSYYNYRSLWNTNDHTVYLSPHWNWEGHEGLPVPVFVYTDGDEAELFVNGKSMGRRKKTDPDLAGTSKAMRRDFGYKVKPDDRENNYYEVVDAYRLRWLEVPYEPGVLRVVAYKSGEKIGEDTVRTAGKPQRLKLTPDRRTLNADGMDLCYVTVEMVDEAGNLCPLAMDTLKFSVEGSARFLGAANGNQMGHDVFTDLTHPLFYGKAVVVLRGIGEESGTATLTVSTEGGMVSEAEVRFL